MLRIPVLLALAAVTSACSAPGATKHAEPEPKIKLAPTPGHRTELQVLESNPYSGYYVAFTHQVPLTRFFRVLGRADCDDVVRLYLLTPKLVNANPNRYISPKYTEDKPTYQCANLFHGKFRDGDPRLVGSDGVIFDAESAEVKDAYWIANKQVFMKGWAIKFVDGTPEEIKARFDARPRDAIDHLQIRSAAYWVEQHPDYKHTDAMVAAMDLADEDSARTGWSKSRAAILNALAATNHPTENLEPYRMIMRAGLFEHLRLRPTDSRTVSPLYDVGPAPRIAANVLACKAASEDVALFWRLIDASPSTQHVVHAARGLVAAGKREELARRVRETGLDNLVNAVREIAAGRDADAFKCKGRDA